MIEAVATDLDDTLITENRISRINLECLRQLSKNGIKLIIASGRYPLYIRWLLEQYQIEADICALNGAYISLYNGKKLKESLLDNNTAIQIEEFLIQGDYYFHTYNYDSIFATHLRLQHIPYQKTDKGIKFYNNVYVSNTPIQDGIKLGPGIYKIFITKENDNLVLKNFLNNVKNICISSSGEDNYEINSKDCNKMTGIDEILKIYGLTRSNLLAIGDHINDIPMIRGAKIGVAMGNSHQDLKKQADYVSSNYDENGFAVAMNKFILGDSK